MRASRTERKEYSRIASETGLSAEEVACAVGSFFDAIGRYSRTLPFDDARKIYSRKKFMEYSKVWNIPRIGRIGTAYSRYIAWRRNESRHLPQEPRRNYRTRIPQDEIEHIAGDIISGKTPAPLRKRKGSELYNTVWLVGENGKKLARQVIPKTE